MTTTDTRETVRPWWARTVRWYPVLIAAVAAVLAAYLGLCGLVIDLSLTAKRIVSDETPLNAGFVAEAIEFESNGGRISLRGWLLSSSGDRAIILVHGTPGSASAWERYLEHPVANARMIAIDRLGFGRSAKGGVERSIGEHARCLEPLLGEPGEPPAILVGHSLGGPIVAWAAAEFPERVAGIVIIAGALDPCRPA